MKVQRLFGTVGAVLMIGYANSNTVAKLSAAPANGADSLAMVQSEKPSQVALDKALVSEFRRGSMPT